MELIVLTFIFSIIFLVVKYRILKVYDARQIQKRVKKRPEYGYIYFYRGAGENPFQVKIGRAKDWFKRLQGSRTSVGAKGFHIYGIVMVKNDVFAEKFIHKKFADRRYTKRNEWFSLNLPLYLYIRRVRDPALTQLARERLALD